MTIRTFGENPTHRATLKGHEARFCQEDFQHATDWLITEAGGWSPEMLVEELREIAEAVPINVVPRIASTMVEERVDAMRADERAARDAGFSLPQPIFTLGMRVNDTGVENARRFRQEYEAKPLVTEACDDLIREIEGEARRDREIDVQDLAMGPDGRWLMPDQRPGHSGHRVAVPMTETAFSGYCTRVDMGGAAYLQRCTPDLRALNVNHWIGRQTARELAELEEWQAHRADMSEDEPEPQRLTMRARTRGGAREIYATVSSRYQALDADKIAAAIREAVPPDARGSILYDGQRTRIECMFHSTVLPEDYAAGEIFRAGVIVRTDDVGLGSIRVSSVVERNLCLNLITLHTAEQRVAGIRHVGSSLATKFADAFAEAQSKIEHFRETWGYAKADVVAAAIEEEARAKADADQLAGFFWALLKRDLFRVPGKKVEAVRGMVGAYYREVVRSPVQDLRRTDVVNALTRYAHEVAAAQDPWVEDEIQEAAGKLLVSRKPLPWEAAPISFAA